MCFGKRDFEIQSIKFNNPFFVMMRGIRYA